MKKTVKKRLIAVRLSEEDFLFLKERSDRTGMPVSTLIRDLIRSKEDPSFQREFLAVLKKIRTDLSYCRMRIARECTEETVQMITSLITEIYDALDALVKGDEACGDHKARSS